MKKDAVELTRIDPLACVDPKARLGSGVRIGPFSVVGPDAVLEDGVVLQSHVVIEGHTTLGAGTTVGPFTVLGGPPQHLRYGGEPTEVVIGPGSIVREQVTIHRGTEFGGGVTRLGAGTMVMAAAHIGHDCQIGDGVIIASNASIAGHVTIGENAFLGGLAGVHQFCRIGKRAMIGGLAAVSRDVIPYGSVYGNHAKLAGLNMVGLKRGGATREELAALHGAYRFIFEAGTEGQTFATRVIEAKTRFAHIPEVVEIVAFLLEDTKRPILGPL